MKNKVQSRNSDVKAICSCELDLEEMTLAKIRWIIIEELNVNLRIQFSNTEISSCSQKFFNAADLSNDDKVTKEEFLTAMGALPEADHK